MTMRSPGILLLALALGALCAVALGCGSKTNLARIPSGSAQRLDSELDALRDAVDAGRCSGIAQRVTTLQASVAGLSRSVDPRLRARLTQGVANLASIAPPECLKRAQPTTPTVTTDTTTTPTDTTTTDTTTAPTTTDTTPTNTAPTVTIPPPTTTTPPPPPGGGTAAPTATTP